MHNNVQKKKDEVVLWEIVTTQRKPQYGGRGKTLSIIGQDDDDAAAPRRKNARTQSSSQSRNARAKQIYRRRKARRRRAYFYRTLAFCMVLCCCVLVGMLIGEVYKSVQQWKSSDTISSINIPVFSEIGKSKIEAPEISTAFLDVNEYSRPGTKLKKVKNIFVHYTANPGTSAVNNRSYFANLSITKERAASAHYIIGYEGEIIQCIPADEQAYAVMTRNEDSLSIECCYLDEDGKFTQETYDSLVHILAWLLQEYKLESGDILRHYDCGGKLCPLYYVEHEDAWEQLLADVDAYMLEAD
ncbi:MAG: peptidoglycan recognition protein family protein [Bacillus sp. (in: Bacteria)]|nr:peptidoglycan recognition protein family protein [Bacillus sp. (in: firmicutes)]MCM1425426.1 peptidoglycan recognition protein family protein [Eubacterium sp.]